MRAAANARHAVTNFQSTDTLSKLSTVVGVYTGGPEIIAETTGREGLAWSTMCIYIYTPLVRCWVTYPAVERDKSGNCDLDTVGYVLHRESVLFFSEEIKEEEAFVVRRELCARNSRGVLTS